jgi:hypothetical protein
MGHFVSERKTLLQSITNTIADYREGEIPKPTAAHVDRWLNQFAAPVQLPILREMAHVLGRTYISKAKVETFLKTVITSKKLAGDDCCAFWKNVHFLNIQRGGNSQRDMLDMFSGVLNRICKLTIAQCGKTPEAFVYLDDVLFTGNRIRTDLSAWIRSDAPQTVKLHVITMGLHSGGQYYARTQIAEAAKAAGKTVNITWWRSVEIEDRKNSTDTSDVLRPTVIPADPATQAYVQGLRFPPVLRKPGNVGAQQFFSSEGGRSLLEQELLKTGVHIRSICPHLNAYMRPLGNMVLETPGFGSLFVTFRNCPNNTPLALWAGNPWYPLFARKTN